MVSFHFGLWEYLPQVFARRGYRVGLVVGRQRDPAVRRQLARMRNRQRVRAGIEARARSISGFMLDNTSRGNQCWVPVGSVQLRMPTLPFRLASRRGTGVVPAFARLERGRLRIDIGHPTDEKGVAEALLAQVRAHPEEWLFWGKSGGVQAAVPDAPQRRRSSPVSEAA